MKIKRPRPPGTGGGNSLRLSIYPQHRNWGSLVGCYKLIAMQAVVITRLGGPEVLEVQDVSEPVRKPGEELVRVEAGGLNFADTLAARGGYPGTPKPPLVAGREFSGKRVTDGERVMGYTQWGAFAEIVSARNSLVWPVPEGWTEEEGAAFPVNYFTAYLAYWKAGLLEASSGARVLIHAAAGGVGTAAIAIGNILGIETYGTSSCDEKLARACEMGLEHAINYQRQDYEEAIRELTRGEGVDAVFEMLGGEHTAKGVRCLRDFGRVICYGTATGQPAQLNPGILYAKGASVHGLWLTYLATKPEVIGSAWNQLSTWIAQGRLRPTLGHVLPIDQVGEAYRLLTEGKNFAKIVLRITRASDRD